MRNSRATLMGLRERKKLTTRQALSWAALRLAVELGPERVRREDIAAEADVSVRTFNNYFSSKEAAIVSLGVDRAARVGNGLRERPPSEPLAEALSRAYAEQYADGPDFDAEWKARIRLIMSAPELQGEYLKSLLTIEQSLAAAIAERWGMDVERDLRPRVLAAAVCGAERVAVGYWLDAATTTDLPTLLRQAISQVVSDPARPADLDSTPGR